MRAQMTVIGLVVLLLMACDGWKPRSEGKDQLADQPAQAISLGKGSRPASAEEVPASAPGPDPWFRTSSPFDLSSRLIIRTGQASIEVDSLEPSMAALRRLVQRAGGFVADASVQSGRKQLRTASLELKVPASRFDELIEGLEPVGRLQFVNVGADDVSEEYVDLSARVANGRRLEDRLVELLRTRTGKLQDVLTVERELARVREDIERMEGRLRFLKEGAQLSTLAVSLYEPAPLVASHPGRNVLGEAFKTAWRNFIGVLAGAIASLGFVAPVLAFGWGVLVAARKYRKRPAQAGA